MHLAPGMRVRCVKPSCEISRGEYTVITPNGAGVFLHEIPNMWFFNWRFKPIIRVKAQCVPSLDLQVKRAIARVEAMTPEQQAAHWAAQRESWVRGEMALGAR